MAQPPNRTAVALWIETGAVSVLLGADLEETSEPGTGWSVIVQSKERRSGKASVFNVPHHGSATSYAPEVWSEMLAVDPIAILTAFIKGRVTLPTADEANRIKEHTPRAYTTSSRRRRETKAR